MSSRRKLMSSRWKTGPRKDKKPGFRFAPEWQKGGREVTGTAETFILHLCRMMGLVLRIGTDWRGAALSGNLSAAFWKVRSDMSLSLSSSCFSRDFLSWNWAGFLKINRYRHLPWVPAIKINRRPARLARRRRRVLPRRRSISALLTFFREHHGAGFSVSNLDLKIVLI